MNERDYVLGTHDAEIERLGLQHRVWRPRALEAWRRGGVTAGQTVVDVGAGPGFATLDLAEIVGPAGRVIAVERSARFLAALDARARGLGVTNVSTIEADLLDLPPMDGVADALWCRWVLCFVADPRAALRKMLAMLKPGGSAIFHEYADYRSWRLAPRRLALERYVDAVMASWRATGGEPDIALDLAGWLADEGFSVEVRPIIDAVRPSSDIWQWPASFVESGSARLAELGYLAADEAEAIRRELSDAGARPTSLMITPLVLELIARRS
jgi:ubiquinone/menaquinone biosynthesis C-methylase UbiE